MRCIKTTTSTYTPESVAEGDAASHDTGETFDCEPDQYDIDDGLTAVDIAAKQIRGQLGHASSTSYHRGVWYTQNEGSRDRAYFERGEETIESYHLEGFTLDEERQIFGIVTRKRA